MAVVTKRFVNVFVCLFLNTVFASEGNNNSENEIFSPTNVIDKPGGCRIHINGHLKKDSRLILHPYSSSIDGYRFYLPSAAQNFLSFQYGQEVVFACPNGVYEHARCHTDDTFLVSASREATVSNITCRRPLRGLVRSFGRCHNNKYNYLGIGMVIRPDQSTHEFIKLIDICFNPTLRNTLYAKFTLMQSVESRQKNVKRSNFTCSPYFGNLTQQFDDIYGRRTQHNKFIILLGSKNQTDKFINQSVRSDLYLTKGNLVTFQDFVYYSKQQVTSFCVNTAPIWQVIRKGNWRNLEESIRKYASSKGKDLTVYAGTYGVLKLPHENGTRVPIYLATDLNGNEVVPVPQLLWKLVYDRLLRQGIVFLGVNNHYNNFNLTEYEICNDVCNATASWFTGWDRFQVNFGYIYCCSVTAFLTETNAVPEFRDVVVNLLI